MEVAVVPGFFQGLRVYQITDAPLQLVIFLLEQVPYNAICVIEALKFSFLLRREFNVDKLVRSKYDGLMDCFKYFLFVTYLSPE